MHSQRLGFATILSAALAASSGAAQTPPTGTAAASYDEGALSDLRESLQGDPSMDDSPDPPVPGAPPAPGVPPVPEARSESPESLPGLSTAPRALADLPSSGGSAASQAVALPSGPSSVLGMGESFTTQLSTGIVSFTVPLRLLGARGGVQPRLDITYSSASGFGTAGKGWSLGASAVSRQTDRGVPRYDDRADFHPEQDRFVFGGMELVPICTVSATACTGKLIGETMPSWASGWQYFRARIEGGFLRFFWSPDHRTWRVQSKDGGNFELGVPRDGSEYLGALERNPEREAEIFRWYIVRQYDSEGGVNATADPQPVNAVVYRYKNDDGATYLADIYDTSPAANPTSKDVNTYAHHTHVAYEARPDMVQSFKSGWLVEHRLRVLRVDVTSKPFSGAATSARALVRRYHLGYEPGLHTSMLTSVQMEGRCPAPATEASDGILAGTNCPRLPPLTFAYKRVAGPAAPLHDANGLAFETFNEEIRELPESPPRSLDDALTGLMDVNADGLPDVLVTAPGLYDGRHGVFFNGVTASGANGFGGLTKMDVERVGNVDASVLRLDNTNVSPLDLDADGIVNLVHMPQGKKYSVFSPVKTGSTWSWKGRQVATASEQDIKIDFTREARNTQVMDVNGDGLVDVVHSSPTEIQTFFALGRYPAGNDQFGRAEWTSSATASIKNDPVTACAPWSGAPLTFSDSDVRIADLNGDGLPDIVRVRPGQILYWPGRGNGFWGTGTRDDCTKGQHTQDRHVQMLNSPQFGATRPGTLLMSDVNADGLSDLIEVHGKGVDIYLNDNGLGWTNRYLIEETPVLPNGSNYMRLTDIDGSGTPDILWGRADEYRYVDLTGGVVPQLLVRTANGVGATTDFQYATTTDVMRQAAAQGSPWTSFTPTVSPVLVRSTVRDNLERVGRPGGALVTEYTYRDPVYEGRQREFRGFREATVRTLGDFNAPTATTRTVFQLGECSEGFQGSVADVCSPSLRWQDNWREALKGLPVLVESSNEAGVYLSSAHTTYEIRQLYTGRDGRRVTVPYPRAKDTFLYDTGVWVPSSTAVNLDEVQANLAGITHTETRSVVKRGGFATARVRARSVFDDFGNTVDSIQDGCVEGCPEGVDEVITAHSDYALTPGDTSGWLWRETRDYVIGSVQTARRNERIHTYNAQGKLLTTRAVLSGTLPLDRFHATGLPIAPVPVDASGGVAEPVEMVLLQNTYDTLGHVTSARGASGRCSATGFDTLYKQLPVLATNNVGTLGGNGCGSLALKHDLTYDRGFSAVVDSLDPTSQPAHFEYDGFGRLVASTSADPANPGQLAPQPSLTVDYFLPADPVAEPFSKTIIKTLDGPHFSSTSYQEKRVYKDGLGRTIVTLSQADPGAGDGDAWIASGFIEYDSKGLPARTHGPWYTSNAFTLAELPDPGDICQPEASNYREYDAFGRLVWRNGRDGQPDLYTRYHALSQDVFDGADLGSGPEQGSYNSLASDGHGRGVRRTQYVHMGADLEPRHVVNEYLPTGEVRRVIQRRDGVPDVVRWLRYDSLGRMVLNAEPNTTANFNADPSTLPANLKAWRYAYNDAGDLVGSSDARGCGMNYHYDAAGRPIAQDRSPCLAHHAPYTPANTTTGDGTEAFYRYDAADPDTNIVDAAGQTFTVDGAYLLGRLSSTSSLGAKTVVSYDALGRVIGTAIRVVKPGAPSSTLASRYAPRWYTRSQTYDLLGRTRTSTTGATLPQLLGGGSSQLSYAYTKSNRLSSVGGSYGTLFSGAVQLADGRPLNMTLGDVAHTQRSYCYDVNHRVASLQTYRAVPQLWSTAPPGSPYTPPSAASFTTQTSLEDYDFQYDVVDNITRIRDFRIVSEWPDKAKPVTRNFEYDELYRLTRVAYTYPTTVDQWKSPFEFENNNAAETPQPVPTVSFTNRVAEQRFKYDWLGNPQQTTDDQNGFWDRSLGDTVRGSPTSGPNRILTASNRTLAPTSTRKGDLEVAYDASGNVTGLMVKRDGSCLPSTASCWQRFTYEWNEVGELVRARRWSLAGADRTTYGTVTAPLPPDPPPAAMNYTEMTYVYDAGGRRVLKAAKAQGATRYTVYPLSGLELRGTDWNTTTPNDYALDPVKVQLLLPAGPVTARVLYSAESLPTLTSGQLHVFLEFSDHLGSTSFVIDHATGELVEHATYQAYGAVESDHRPGRWGDFREPYRFGGKEEDIEVGLAYFGARYYSPYLNVWMSADPVTIHALGSDINPYAYVHGTPVMGIDPDGREPITIGIILTAAAIGAATAAGTSIVYQACTVGWNNIDWGWDGVLGAAAIGAVGGAVSAGVGGAVANATGSKVLGGLYGGMASGAASQAASYAITGRSSGVGQAMLSGGLSGAAGGAIGAGGSSLGHSLGSSAVGNITGFTVSGALGEKASVGSFFLSLGTGLATSAATYQAPKGGQGAGNGVKETWVPVEDAAGGEFNGPEADVHFNVDTQLKEPKLGSNLSFSSADITGIPIEHNTDGQSSISLGFGSLALKFNDSGQFSMQLRLGPETWTYTGTLPPPWAQYSFSLAEAGGLGGAFAGYYITETAKGAQLGAQIGAVTGAVVGPPAVQLGLDMGRILGDVVQRGYPGMQEQYRKGNFEYPNTFGGKR